MTRVIAAAVAFVAAVLLTATLMHQPPATAAAASDGNTGKGIVYLLRGGANIFSTGMDDLAVKLRDKGVAARSVGYASWRDFASEIGERYGKSRQPVILLGHSFGANAAMLLAGQLAKSNTPVALMILFDPTAVLKTPPNVKRLINFYSATVAGMNLEVLPGPHFTGMLENVAQTDVGHLELDNDVRLHDKSIVEILKALGGRARTAAE